MPPAGYNVLDTLCLVLIAVCAVILTVHFVG